MPLVEARCPNCNGHLMVDSAKKAAVCPYCQGAYIVEEAIHNYTFKVENLNADVVNFHDDRAAEGRLKAGEAFLTIKNWDKAEQAFQEACDLTPQDYRGWWGKIRAISQEFSAERFLKKEIDDLELLFSRAMTFAPKQEESRLREIFEAYISKQKARFQKCHKKLAERIDSDQRRADSLQSEWDDWNGKNFEPIDVLDFLDRTFPGFLCDASFIWGLIRFFIRGDLLSIVLIAVPVLVVIGILLHNGPEKARIEERSRRMSSLREEIDRLNSERYRFEAADRYLTQDSSRGLSYGDDKVFRELMQELGL